MTQAVDNTSKMSSSATSPLQEIITAQPAVLLGLIAHLVGTPLQDDIAPVVHRLLRLGQDIIAASQARPGRRPRSANSAGAGRGRDNGVPSLFEGHLLFDPPREHLPSRPQKFAAARAQGLSRLVAFHAATRQGLALIGPSTAARSSEAGARV